jgi:flagellar hook-associated protein 1 FlgK
LSNASGTGKLHMQDEVAQHVKELASLTDIQLIERADGGVDIDAAAGRALVVGHTAYAMTAVATGPQGRVAVQMGGVTVTSQLTGGTLGGVLRARDTHIPAYLQRLDEQAFALADAVNTVHAAAFDSAGNTGQNFFAFTTAPVGVTGAAAALVVDPAVAADSRRVAAAEAAVAGDNRAARAIANLRTATLLDGGTATLGDAWGQLLFRVGRDTQLANGEATLRKQVVSQLESLRDQVSGISLDEEAMQLMKFQRAYEANARFFQVVDETLDTLIAAIGR